MYGADSKQFFAALAAGLALAGCGSGGGGDDSGNGNTDNSGPGLPSLSIAAVSMDEGHSATGDLEFTVTLSAASTSVVSVEYSTADATADQSDYDAVDGELEIPAGDTTATIAVPVHGDTEIEADEEFTVALANPVDATVATGVAVGTIRNDDFPLLSIASATIDEGDNGDTALVFDVSMDATAIGDVTVDYATSNVVATAGDDYAGMNGTLTIPEGDVAAVVEVMISGDTDIEQDEQFVVNLLNASSNARIDEDEAIGLIVNDDFPKITIEPGSVTEADAGVRTLSFPLGLDAAAFEDLVVSYATSDDTATAGDDYVAKNGSVTVPAGNTDAKIDIETMGDTIAESTETFTVTLTGVQGGAEIEVGAAQGTILDNDTPPEDPQLIASNSSVTEGDVGTTTLRFDILLDRASNDDVRFTYATLDGTATSPDDFAAASGEATIAAGASSAAVDVLVNGDTDDEGNESFTLELAIVAGMATLATPQVSGTIVDDDDQTEPEPRLTISGASVTEGDTGTIDM